MTLLSGRCVRAPMANDNEFTAIVGAVGVVGGAFLREIFQLFGKKHEVKGELEKSFLSAHDKLREDLMAYADMAIKQSREAVAAVQRYQQEMIDKDERLGALSIENAALLLKVADSGEMKRKIMLLEHTVTTAMGTIDDLTKRLAKHERNCVKPRTRKR